MSGRGSKLEIVRLLNRAANARWLDDIGFISRSQGERRERQRRRPERRVTITSRSRERSSTGSRRPTTATAGRRCWSTGATEPITRRIATELPRHDRRRRARAPAVVLLRQGRRRPSSVMRSSPTTSRCPSNVTYVANGFVSHNTIGLMMDCDTTGIEPDLGLVKTKKLVGGGTMSIVNQTIPRALTRLGYTAEQVDEIVAYIDDREDDPRRAAPRPQPPGRVRLLDGRQHDPLRGPRPHDGRGAAVLVGRHLEVRDRRDACCRRATAWSASPLFTRARPPTRSVTRSSRSIRSMERRRRAPSTTAVFVR